METKMRKKNLKKIKLRKRSIAMVSAALLLSGSVCMVAAAAEKTSATQNELHSHGAIHYQDGAETVVIDSADLYTLADTLDLFKVRVAEQLGTQSTYLSKDANGVPLTKTKGIYVTHLKPTASDEVDPATLSFHTILEGIAASQTIPSDPAVYDMASGTKLYQGKDGKLQIGQKQQEDAQEVHIHAATAAELSAGAAAWVDGKLILGTGDNNKTYYEESSGAASGNGSVSVPVFSDFHTVGGYYASFKGEIPYSFTPGKSLLLLFDGPLNPTFDGANLPDSAVVGTWFSLYYWKNNPHSKIKVTVEKAYGGYNNKLLMKEW